MWCLIDRFNHVLPLDGFLRRLLVIRLFNANNVQRLTDISFISPFYDWFDWLITELFDKHRYLLKTARKIHSDRPVSPTGNLIAVNLILRIFFQCLRDWLFDWDVSVNICLLLYLHSTETAEFHLFFYWRKSTIHLNRKSTILKYKISLILVLIFSSSVYFAGINHFGAISREKEESNVEGTPDQFCGPVKNCIPNSAWVCRAIVRKKCRTVLIKKQSCI